MTEFSNIVVIGVGLLGGSFCRAARVIYPNVKITGCGRNRENLQQALDEGAIDYISSPGLPDLSDVDIVLVAVPVKTSVSIILEILDNPSFRDDALVIDVGSVKGKLVERISEHPRSGRFIGCHPMAGSEKTGFASSSSNLYRGSSVIITPHEANSEREVEMISQLWIALGAKVTLIDARLHDVYTAYTSHLMHIVSSAAVNAVESKCAGIEKEKLELFIGSGFKDMTRLASGSPDMWADISEYNWENISESVDRMIGALHNFKTLISDLKNNQNNVHDFFMRAKKYRDWLI